MTSAASAPTAPQDRIEILDVLRGFAIFGILLVNMWVFSGSAWLTDSFQGTLDQMSFRIIEWTAAGKFLNLFSFLFGVGFSLQLTRGRNARGFGARYGRRLASLLLIGVGHGVLISWVDTLGGYAVLGALLVLCAWLSNRAILRVALGCLLLPLLVAMAGSAGGDDSVLGRLATPLVTKQAERDVHRDGDYAAIVAGRLTFWKRVYSTPSWYVSLLGTEFVMFLTGLYVGRRRLFERLPANIPKVRAALPWLFMTGATLTWASTSSEIAFNGLPFGLGAPVQDRLFFLGAVALSTAYASIVALATQSRIWRPRFAPLAFVGRMALTNYLLQSVSCSFLFHPYGFGLYGMVGPAVGSAATVAIFAVQIALSGWWLRYARFGPVEWLWRSVTYLKWQPWRLYVGR